MSKMLFLNVLFSVLVQKIREYTLYSGKVSRVEGFIPKGTTTDVSFVFLLQFYNEIKQ